MEEMESRNTLKRRLSGHSRAQWTSGRLVEDVHLIEARQK